MHARTDYLRVRRDYMHAHNKLRGGTAGAGGGDGARGGVSTGGQGIAGSGPAARYGASSCWKWIPIVEVLVVIHVCWFVVSKKREAATSRCDACALAREAGSGFRHRRSSMLSACIGCLETGERREAFTNWTSRALDHSYVYQSCACHPGMENAARRSKLDGTSLKPLHVVSTVDLVFCALFCVSSCVFC